jgi:nucleoside-diphosphate-sugar epimerase
MEHTRCWLAAYTRSRHESHVASQLSFKGVEALLPTYISDCVEGLMRLMASSHHEPLNLGTEELVSVNGLVELICAIAGKRLTKRHDLSRPQGVRGRNSDNSRLRTVLGWEPQTRLLDGLDVTYHWIEKELQEQGRVAEVLAYASD